MHWFQITCWKSREVEDKPMLTEGKGDERRGRRRTRREGGGQGETLQNIQSTFIILSQLNFKTILWSGYCQCSLID